MSDTKNNSIETKQADTELKSAEKNDVQAKNVDAQAYVGTGAINTSRKSFSDNNIENSDVDFNTISNFNVENGGKLTYNQAKSADAIYAEHETGVKKFDKFKEEVKTTADGIYQKTTPGKIDNFINNIKSEQAEFDAKQKATRDADEARKEALKDAKNQAAIDKVLGNNNSNRFSSAINMQVPKDGNKSTDLSK